jgi:hypothetical protein
MTRRRTATNSGAKKKAASKRASPLPRGEQARDQGPMRRHRPLSISGCRSAGARRLGPRS